MNNELYHFGVKGMRWGVRRYEDKNGHLTAAGKKRYDDSSQSRMAMDDAKRALDAHTAKFNKKYGKLDGTKDQYKNIESDTNKTLALNKAYKEAKRNYRNRRMTDPSIKKSALQEAHKSAQKRYNTYKKELDSINKVYDQHVQKRDFYKKQYQKNGDRHSKAEYRKYDNAVKGMDGAKEFYMKKLNSYQEEMRQLSDAQKAYHDAFHDNNELYHFGVRGMKWGQRRYQNQDGSYTAQGRGRYAPTGSSRRSSSGSRSSSSSSDRRARLKKAAKIGAGVAAAGLAAYGGYRLAKSGKLSGLSSGVKSAASRVRSSNAGKKVGSDARRVANKVGNSGVGRRVKRGVNSAQYHTTKIKNELSYRRGRQNRR